MVVVMMVMTTRRLLSPFSKITIIIESNHLRSIVSQEVTLLGTLYTLYSSFDDLYVLVWEMETLAGK